MWEEKDRERMNRREQNAMKWLLTILDIAAADEKDLKNRLECVPYGRQRMRLAVGGLRKLCFDLIDTITSDQARNLQNTMKDYEVRLVPKASPMTTNVVMERGGLVKLVDMAREKCKGCVEDGNGARQCELYRFLEVTSPMDDYGDGLMCPYALAEWER